MGGWKVNVAIGIGFVCVASFAAVPLWYEPTPKAEKDCSMLAQRVPRWYADLSSTHPPRQELARRLVDCGTLDERHEDGVRALLGPPDERANTGWGYRTGERYEGDSSGTWLRVAFDGARVRKVTLEPADA